MKRVMQMVMGVVVLLGSSMATGQTKIDEQRMQKDIEVAENILGTLMRQQLGRRNFFPVLTRYRVARCSNEGCMWKMKLHAIN